MLVDRRGPARRGGLGQGQPVEAVLEDRVDVPIGAGADGEGAGARGLEALVRRSAAPSRKRPRQER